ncbi:hypothetical protein [Aeromonas dhakensis]|uniref:hypothetical protein n=2 Tax=Aeromonas dhakensis TaxID=196024 RepID=UPI001AF2700B|nr:hypothetical protein [Aeromonas dhakensis]QSR54668.1 hypothetical protein GO601_04030 [Aeromonas dhakensis]
MNLYRVLMLDDGTINEVVDAITRKLKRNGIGISVDIINPQEQKYKSSNNSEIDFDKIKKDIKDNYSHTKYDVVACDFSFSSSALNGFDLIQWIINEAKSSRYRFKSAKFVCYSSEEDKFKEHIIQNDKLIKLIRLNIYDFYKRDNLSEGITSLIKKIDGTFSMSSHIKYLLDNSAGLNFNFIYPPFKNRKFAEIALEIENESHHGVAFQKYFSELTFAHIVELNKNEE